MQISGAKHASGEYPRTLEVVPDRAPTPPEGLGQPDELQPPAVGAELPAPLPVPTSPAVEPVAEPVFRPHSRRQRAPHMDLYAPTWMHRLVRLLLLDEHGPMPRTVQAQVGFATMLMGVQFCLDMLAWILGFRWVFVNAMGWPGWILAVVFAFLVSSIILIFERFVVTADVTASKVPLFLNPAILMRIGVVVLFASVTAIPVEMLVFNDVIQGRLNGEVQNIREEARKSLRADFHKDIDDLAEEESTARKRLKDETPTVSLSDLSTPKLDGTIADLQKQLDETITAIKLEERGWREGHTAGHGPEWLQLDTKRQNLERQLAEAKAMRQAELDNRSADNRKAESTAADRHFSELSKISERYEPRKRELEKKLRDVDRLTDAELSKATRREFAVVDGFARRWKILQDLEKEEPMYATTKWGVRVLFIAFGLLVLTTKALFNPPTKRYYAGRDPLIPDDEPS
jgi:hypothetical protein